MNKRELCVTNLAKEFCLPSGQVVLLFKKASATFQAGHSYAIMGASGAGKSTFIHVLVGIELPTAGNIYYNDQNILVLSDTQRRSFLNQTIGIVFQQPYLIRELSVLENVMVPGLIAGKLVSECIARSQELLIEVGIPEKADCLPGQLSGGQQHRVAIARALFNKPEFLVADEPTGNLDAQTGLSIINLLIGYQQRHKMSLIISTHDQQLAQRLETTYILANGTLTKKS